MYRDIFYGESPLPEPPVLSFVRLEHPQAAFDFALERGIPLRDFQLFNPDILNYRSRLPLGFYAAVPGRRAEMDDLISSIHASRFKRRANTNTARRR